MVDRSKELYQQQLAAHAAWANFGAGGSPGYPASGHAGFPGAPQGAGATNPYENYMQRLQQFAGLTGSQHNSAMFNNFSKDMSSFAPPFGIPPGHPMHFPSLGGYNPLPAHSPLPAHMKNSPTPPTTPLPAHMRSSPYQQSAYHNSPYAAPYGVPGYGSPQQPPPVGSYSEAAEQARRQAASLHNGSGAFLPPTISSAYSQLQQLSAASGKDAGKRSVSPAVTSNNNYPPHFSGHHAVSSTAASTAATPAYPGHSSSQSTNNGNYDQIAAALLNRFSGQFNNQFMSEMVKSAQPASTVPSYAPPLSVPSYTNLTSHHKDSSHERETPIKPIAKPPVNEESVKPAHEVAARPAPDPPYKPPPDKPHGQPGDKSHVLPVS